MKMSKEIWIIIVVSFIETTCVSVKKGSISEETSAMLSNTTEALLKLQVQNDTSLNNGALWCPHCKLYHTRAAEAVYPFAYQYKLTGDEKFISAAISLGTWLIRQQLPDGSWKETPEEWTGTTTDQLLMMALAYPVLKPHISAEEDAAWLNSITKAGNYLVATMTPEFASINYCATTTASLMVLHQIIPDTSYTMKARELAHRIIAKMDDDYFITGEGGRVFDIKYGVDLGYNLEMSLWGLAIYARLANDDMVLNKVRKSLERHILFVYPDGSVDGSWGIRSNKWTCYGGATSDGCQVLFGMFAHEDPVYRTAALRNLEFLKTCMKDGIVGYGPQHWDVFADPPCIYPTFAKAKNFAMAHAFTVQESGPMPDLPSQISGLNQFQTLNIVTVATLNIYSTVTAYGYKDPKGTESKYMYRPTGGSISNLWIKDFGYLQAASQTEYHRWEPMHFPEADDLKSLTPRIEFEDTTGYFTNLFEFDATFYSRPLEEKYEVKAYGELKNREQKPGGIGYSLTHEFTDNSITKTVSLLFHDKATEVSIVEPVIFHNGMKFSVIDDKTLLIIKQDKKIELKLLEGNAILSAGENADQYWSPYPALKAYPVVFKVRPDKGEIKETIRYRFKILN